MYQAPCIHHTLFQKVLGCLNTGCMPQNQYASYISARFAHKRHSSSDLCNCELIGSGLEQPLTLQTAGRALWDPKDCEAAETRKTQSKAGAHH